MTGSAEDVVEVRLPPADRRSLRDLLEDLARDYGSADDPDLLTTVPGLGHLLPTVVAEPLRAMRYTECPAALVIREGPDLDDPGPTPAHWNERSPGATVLHDMWLVLVTSQLGDPMSWSHLQGGRLLLDLLPIPGQEEWQSGSGSEAELELHVDEADQDHRPDTLAILCLRNRDRVATTVAPCGRLDLERLDVDVLFEPRFRFESASYARTRPVFFGARDHPYIRLDVPFTSALPGDGVAAEALAALAAQLRARTIDVVLDPHDLLLVDNYRAVHGRRKFTSANDGTDRWMRKTTATKDLRQLRSQRPGVNARTATPV